MNLPVDATKGAGGVCGLHGLYDGLVCPGCVRERERRRASALPATQAQNVESRIHAIEVFGQHGGMPDYWRKPLALAFAADEVAATEVLDLLREWLTYSGLRQRAFDPDLDPDDDEYARAAT